MYSTILAAMLLIYATLPYVIELNAVLYAIWVIAAFFCLGTHFTMFPLVNIKVFGSKSGAQMASFIYISSGFSGFLSLWMSNYLSRHYETQSFEIMCYISCITISISLVISRLFFKDEPIRHEEGIFEKMLPTDRSFTSSVSVSSE